MKIWAVALLSACIKPGVDRCRDCPAVDYDITITDRWCTCKDEGKRCNDRVKRPLKLCEEK